MRRIFAFLILASVKIFSTLFYRAHYRWLTPKGNNPWKNIKIMIFLNHTSLFEPLFSQILPFSYLWYLAKHFNIPGADITLERPIVGRFWKLMIPNISSITRKRDESWENYLNSIKEDDIIMIAPEGRMKRADGLDKYGRPMTVRGGIADIVDRINDGKILVCLSGGLHHVQSPGQKIPKLFKDIHMNLSLIDIKDYKASLPKNSRECKIAIVNDLQKRLENDCPKEK
jgi:hypothetical protein